MTEGNPLIDTRKRVGILDVARKAGVSRQTVTRAMNNMTGITPETKERVLAAARELRYRPSRFGRGLVKQDSLTLGLVVIDLMNPYFAELASKVIAVADAAGWTVLVQEIARDRQREERVLAGLATQVDAIVGYIVLDDDVIDELVGDLPVVRVTDRDIPGRRPWIYVDSRPGMSAMLDHLIADGRRNIVMIDCPNEIGISARAHVYSDLYHARGLEPRVFDIPNLREPDVESAAQVATHALDVDPSIDAIIGFNDIVALGALKALSSSGIPVPGRCAVVGIDGLPVGGLVTPRLTTLQLDVDRLARVLFDTMTDSIDDGDPMTDGSPTVTLSQTLIVRDSSGKGTSDKH